MTIRRLAPLLAVVLLSACGDSDVKEVRTWMEQVRKETRPAVKPLPEPKQFVPYAYSPGGAVDPFNPDKLLAEMARVAATSGGLAPDTGRPKELLENYPLDTMQMVGVLQKGGVNYALVQIDRSVHQVRAGQRLGQNFGRVTRVSENGIEIKEVVQDAAGEWVERISTLELQQSKETGK